MQNNNIQIRPIKYNNRGRGDRIRFLSREGLEKGWFNGEYFMVMLI